MSKKNPGAVVTVTIKTSIVSTNYEGKLSPMDMINAMGAILQDFEEMSGQPKAIGIATLMQGLGMMEEGWSLKKENPTMRASVSENTAKED